MSAARGESVARVAPPVARTEVEVAAETLAQVLLTGMFGQDETMVARCVQAVGVTIPDLKQAAQRISARGYVPPKGLFVAQTEATASSTLRETVKCEGCEQTFVRTVSTGPPRRYCYTCRPTKNRLPEGDTRICVRCGIEKPIWEYQKRTDANSRRTTCDPCRKQYQRQRYLSIETSERLGTILRFIVEEGDPCMDDTCPRCHGRFRLGDEVRADDVLLVHHACSEPSA